MGYSIEPIEIWQNGQSETGNFINASIVNDNLHDYAQFYWEISKVTNSSDGDTKKILTRGNTTISGSDYVTWGENQNINLSAYQYICSQLNLTLIP